MNSLKNYGVILASGLGSRCKAEVPKQFLKIANKTILEHTLDAFEINKKIDKIDTRLDAVEEAAKD